MCDKMKTSAGILCCLFPLLCSISSVYSEAKDPKVIVVGNKPEEAHVVQLNSEEDFSNFIKSPSVRVVYFELPETISGEYLNFCYAARGDGDGLFFSTSGPR